MRDALAETSAKEAALPATIRTEGDAVQHTLQALSDVANHLRDLQVLDMHFLRADFVYSGCYAAHTVCCSNSHCAWCGKRGPPFRLWGGNNDRVPVSYASSCLSKFQLDHIIVGYMHASQTLTPL